MYYGEFNDRSDVLNSFQVSEFDGTILYAAYTDEDYSGSASVIFVNEGKFYYVEGSHCSCHGLEDQWEPEETTVAMMRKMMAEGRCYNHRNEAFEAVLRVIDEYNMVEAGDDEIAVAMKLRYG